MFLIKTNKPKQMIKNELFEFNIVPKLQLSLSLQQLIV